MYRKNLDKNIAVVGALRGDPTLSNYAIAQQCGVAESVVRRQRAILEATGLIDRVALHVGTDGVLRQASLV